MVQNTFNKTLIIKELKINPKVKNKVLYAVSNAVTDNQKTIIRKLKAKIKKGTILPDPGSKNKTNKLSSEDLERRLINALDRQPDNANLLGKAIDFFIKVKDKASEMEEEIDIGELLNSGIVKKFSD